METLAGSKLFDGSRYSAALDRVASRSVVLPQVRKYNLSLPEQNEELVAAVYESLGSGNLISESGSEVMAAALEAGILKDSLPHQLADASKTRVLDPEKAKDYQGTVVEYSWRTQGRFVRLLNQDDFYQVAFSRNKHFISSEVQELLRRTSIGIVGLSVGGGIGELLVKTGAENLIVCDGGEVDLHDFNRLGGVDTADIGRNQAVRWAERAYGVNPYLNLKIIGSNLGSDTGPSIAEFIKETGLTIDAVDNLPVKLEMRRQAKKLGVSIVMATDLGSAGLLQIEAANTPIFMGRWNSRYEQALSSGTLDQATKTGIAAAMVGPDNIPPHFLRSVQTAIQSGDLFWPQPGMAAYVSSALAVCAVLMHLEGQPLNNETLVDLRKSLLNQPQILLPTERVAS